MFKDMTSEEQHVLSLCQIELNFSIPQIRDPQVAAILKLLKAIYIKIKVCTTADREAAARLGCVKEEDFVSPKVEQLVRRHSHDPSAVLSGLSIEWSKALCFCFPFMISPKTRLLYFRLSTLDRDRALYLLMQELRGDPSREPAKLSPSKRCKLKVNRENIVECAVNIMQSQPQAHCSLEFDFAEEKGSGLGPTLEFYALVAQALRSIPKLWRPMDNGTLFPAPMDPSGKDEAGTKELKTLFRLMGWVVARAIIDDRLVDLPFAEVFWEMVLGKPLTLVDVCKIDQKNAAFFFELENLAKRKQAIDKDPATEPEHKRRQRESLAFDVLSPTKFPHVERLQGRGPGTALRAPGVRPHRAQA